MTNEPIKFEDEKSEELFYWINTEWSDVKCFSNPSFLIECYGALKALQHLGYDYSWIKDTKRSILNLMTIYND